MDDSDIGNSAPVDPEREAIISNVARRVYDELRHFIIVPPGMINQIYRYGIMSKKTSDGNGKTRVHGPRNYYKDSRTATPDGALIIHRGDPDPHPGTCNTFIHPPYGSSQQYRGEKDRLYHPIVSLAKLSVGSQNCGFCSILYQGIYLMKALWRTDLAKYKWFKSHPEGNRADEQADEPWEKQSDDEFDEEEIGASIVFAKDESSLTVHIVVLNPSAAEILSNEPKTDEDISESLSRDVLDQKLAQLEFYTSPDCPSQWAAFGPAPHIQPKMLSSACIDQIRSWCGDCFLRHRACVESPWLSKRSASKPAAQPISTLPRLRSRLSRVFRRIGHRQSSPGQDYVLAEHRKLLDDGYPARLLKIRWPESELEPPIVTLEETTNPKAIYRYVALSHVWSFTMPYKTIRENYADHKKDIPWDKLSLPFREAIQFILNLHLKLEYVWIDSLCIIQDDPLDKVTELPRMSMIYSRAEIVFAVPGSELGIDKLPIKSIHDPRRPEDSPVYCRQKIPHGNLFTWPQDPSSWLGRAWCMQERLFASRIVLFGGSAEELFFECNTLTACECGGMKANVGPEALTLKQRLTNALTRAKEEEKTQVSLDGLWRVYITACEEYTPRGITFANDKLPAVSSLMHTFSPYLGRYYAGLWEHNLIFSLQWEVLDTSRCRRHGEYVGPSFSWASISGGVIWYIDTKELPREETHEFIAIVDISCVLATSDPCGSVSSGHITLRGNATDMKIEASKTQCAPDGRIEMVKEGTQKVWVTLDSMDDYEKIQPAMMVKCLDIMRDKKGLHGNFVSGLVLLPVEHGGSVYRRIGFSTMSEEHFSDSVLETLTIL